MKKLHIIYNIDHPMSTAFQGINQTVYANNNTIETLLIESEPMVSSIVDTNYDLSYVSDLFNKYNEYPILSKIRV